MRSRMQSHLDIIGNQSQMKTFLTLIFAATQFCKLSIILTFWWGNWFSEKLTKRPDARWVNGRFFWLQCRRLSTTPMCPLSCLQRFAIMLCYLLHRTGSTGTTLYQTKLPRSRWIYKIWAEEGEEETVKVEGKQGAYGRFTKSKRQIIHLKSGG